MVLPLAPPDMPLRPFTPDDLPALYEMIALHLPQVVSQPGFEERRLASKCREPFVWNG